jgi:hypothetical protein
MAKVCRTCQTRMADRGGICGACRQRVLEEPVAPTLRPRIWALAVVLVGFLSIGSSLIAAGVMTHLLLPWQSRLPASNSPVIYQPSVVIEQKTRTVYPYSIVPGGAESLDEAKRAMQEPGMKAIYPDIDFAHLRQVKLKKDLSGYVSYRWGETIYWTSMEVTIRVGETVFTDGVHLVRGRCLNDYSPIPMLPIRPDEPSEQVLDTPVEIPLIAYSFSPEALTPAVPISPSTPGVGVWFPLVPIIPPER